MLYLTLTSALNVKKNLQGDFNKVNMENFSISQLRDGIKSKKFSATEICSWFIEKIKKDSERENKINAFIYFNEDYVISQAKEIDRNIGKIDGKLLGIPIAIKDNINVSSLPTTCGSKILESFISVEDATVVEKIKKENGIILGKTNMDEFAMGSSNETSHYGVVRNPHDRERVSGGSSGGSAACVAANQSPAALGSDTGGSIRQPASFCGIVGLKPTYGLVSRYGLVAFGSSLDQIGPLTKTVEDAALLLDVISGYDPKDSTSVKVNNTNTYETLKDRIDPTSVNVGILQECLSENVQDEVKENLLEISKLLESKGVKIKHVSIPNIKYAIPTYYIVAPAEASSNLARFDGIRYGYRATNTKDLKDLYFKTKTEGFGKEVKRRIMLGNYVLSAGYYDAYYLKALKIRTILKNDFENIFKNVDFVITPTSPTTAFKIGEKISNPIDMYLSDIFTVTVNIIGTCAISIPTGKDKKGLPIGLQIISKPFTEEHLLKFSYFVESLLK